MHIPRGQWEHPVISFLQCPSADSLETYCLIESRPSWLCLAVFTKADWPASLCDLPVFGVLLQSSGITGKCRLSCLYVGTWKPNSSLHSGPASAPTNLANQPSRIFLKFHLHHHLHCTDLYVFVRCLHSISWSPWRCSF